MYSLSIVDNVIIGCRLLFHTIGEPPIMITYHLVLDRTQWELFLSSWLNIPAKSASTKHLMSRMLWSWSHLIMRPCSLVDMRYLPILLRYSACFLVGLKLCRLKLCRAHWRTAKASSGQLLLHRYISIPTTLASLKLRSCGSPSSSWVKGASGAGVVIPPLEFSLSSKPNAVITWSIRPFCFRCTISSSPSSPSLRSTEIPKNLLTLLSWTSRSRLT